MDIRSQLDLNRLRNWSLRRKVIVFLALALLLLPAALVAASDSFSDVPSGSFFHNDIEAIYGARITTGTSPGIYSPGFNVTREQMAAFLHRGLPRVAINSASAIGLPVLNEDYQDRAVVTINTGGTAGGKGFVKLDASLLAYNSDTTGCPCEIQYYLIRDAGGKSLDSYVTVYNRQGGVDGNASGSLTWVFSVPTASLETFRLRARLNSGTATVRSGGAVTAQYIPFGSTGENVLAAQAIESLAVSEAQAPEALASKGNN